MGVLNWTSEHARGEHALLKRLLSTFTEGVVLDVGANEGEYTQFLLGLDAPLTIHAFEPHPRTFARLCDRMRGTGVACHNFAAGSEVGDIQLFDYADADGSSHASVYEGVIENIHKRPAVVHRVKSIRLDKFLAERGISRVVLLKIDTEGAELEVLKGLSGFLDDPKSSIQYIQLEFNEMNVMSRVFFKDILERLPGYRAYRILPRGRVVDITDEDVLSKELFAYQNLLLSRSPLRP